MQKFKIDREKLLEGLNGSKTGFIYNLLELPDTLILEGELLEGGMVEKCCLGCFQYNLAYNKGFCINPECIGCHNKKEEKKCCRDFFVNNILMHRTSCPNFNREKKEECERRHFHEDGGKCSFNRETPKKYEGCGTSCYHTKETTKPRRCLCECHKEEVTLPEKLILRVVSGMTYAPENHDLMLKINEILTYLAFKENKWKNTPIGRWNRAFVLQEILIVRVLTNSQQMKILWLRAYTLGMQLKTQRKIPPDLTGILLNRISISRETKLFSLEAIAEGWTVSTRTLLRYDSPKDREYSLLIRKKGYEKERTRDRSICQLCPIKLEGHPRCSTCTMLIHGEPECSCNDCVVVLDPYKLILHINNQ